MITVVEVTPNLVQFTWPHIEAFLEKVVKSDGLEANITIQKLKEATFAGHYNLLVYIKNNALVGGMAMQYQDRPTGRVAFVCAVGGKDISSLDVWNQTKEIFRRHGAISSEAYMRPSRFRLSRKFGYETKYHVATVTL